MILKNDTLYSDGEVTIPEGSGLIYEVIRVIDGAALYFSEHYDRFLASALAKNAQLPAEEIFLRRIHRFIHAVDVPDFNIKTILDPAGGDLYIFRSPAAYPEARLYEQGVHTELLPYRRRDPNAKILNTELAQLAQRLRDETGAYELLLTDDQGHITEGARSNVFFVRGGELLTSPLDSVLPGVTRQRVIAVAHHLSIAVREVPIPTEDLNGFDGAFLSGTSPKILPIAAVGPIALESARHPLIRSLISAFDADMAADLAVWRARIGKLGSGA